jgi:hypothetical protein
MAEPDDDEPADPPPPPTPPPRRAWEPPRIKSGQLFESNSLACFKHGVGVFECGMEPPFKS